MSSHVKIGFANCQINPSQIQFDIVIANDGDGIAILKFAGATIRLTTNKGIVPAGSTVTPAYLGNSDFAHAFEVAGVNYALTYNATTGAVVLTNSMGNYNATTGIEIPAGTTKVIGTFTLTLSSGSWVTGQNVGLAWATAGSSGVVLYENGISKNFNSNTNRTLDTPCSLTA